MTTQIKVGLLIGSSNFLTNKKIPLNKTFGPEKLFYVCRVCIQHYSLKNFGNNTMKLSVIEEKLYSKYFFNRLRFQNLPSDPKSYRAFGETGPWIVTRMSSVWNFCSRSSCHFVGNQRRCREIRLFSQATT